MININKELRYERYACSCKLKEGKFEKFMGFMQSEEAIKERSKVADLSKTIATVSPDKSNVMFKIYVHDEII